MLRLWFGWFRCGFWWLGLTWQVNVIKMLSNFFFIYWYYHKNIFWALRKWFEIVKRWFWVVWRWFGVVWWWFGANMAGQRNKNAFKILFQLLILSQKHILGVKKVVWDGFNVVWGGLEVFWGGLGCFHGPVCDGPSFVRSVHEYLSVRPCFAL